MFEIDQLFLDEYKKFENHIKTLYPDSENPVNSYIEDHTLINPRVIKELRHIRNKISHDISAKPFANSESLRNIQDLNRFTGIADTSVKADIDKNKKQNVLSNVQISEKPVPEKIKTTVESPVIKKTVNNTNTIKTTDKKDITKYTNRAVIKKLSKEERDFGFYIAVIAFLIPVALLIAIIIFMLQR